MCFCACGERYRFRSWYISRCAHFVLSFHLEFTSCFLFDFHSFSFSFLSFLGVLAVSPHCLTITRHTHTHTQQKVYRVGTVCLSLGYTPAVMDDGWFQDTNHQHFERSCCYVGCCYMLPDALILLFPFLLFFWGRVFLPMFLFWQIFIIIIIVVVLGRHHTAAQRWSYISLAAKQEEHQLVSKANKPITYRFRHTQQPSSSRATKRREW